MTTTTTPAKTKVGDFLVWFSHEYNSLRMGRTTLDSMEFDDAAFSRPELSICHSIYAESATTESATTA